MENLRGFDSRMGKELTSSVGYSQNNPLPSGTALLVRVRFSTVSAQISAKE